MIVVLDQAIVPYKKCMHHSFSLCYQPMQRTTKYFCSAGTLLSMMKAWEQHLTTSLFSTSYFGLYTISVTGFKM